MKKEFFSEAGRRLMAGLAVFSFCSLTAGAAPVVIIKADDFRGPDQKWTDFLAASRKLGVKVSIGVVAESIAGNTGTSQWMKAEEAHGDVEFWNSGWEHKQSADKGGIVTEFAGSGLAQQRQFFTQAQTALKTAVGYDVDTFGTPYNAFDADTATVINETPAIHVFFAHNLALARKLLDPRVAVIDVVGESEGVGRPNAQKFAALWARGIGNENLIALQFNPTYFSDASLGEYTKIVDYVKAQGGVIELPSESVGY